MEEELYSEENYNVSKKKKSLIRDNFAKDIETVRKSWLCNTKCNLEIFRKDKQQFPDPFG